MSSVTTENLDPKVLPRAEHTVSRSRISSGALKVLYRLHRAGYTAYLVGGGVRDLLLGRTPKDFDIATNARPQEVRRLFRNSRIIGRRFRLVHVLFAGETVEVSTFRAGVEPPDVPEEPQDDERWEDEEQAQDAASETATDENNIFGTPAEDAQRRDFTINALFYNIADFSVLDYVGGLEDLAAGVIRTIGEPERRFVEDPVRMMRALEYSERLGFALTDDLAEAIRSRAALIAEASPARLTYELLESLRSGASAGIVRAWRRFGILERIFPAAAANGHALDRVLPVVDRQLEAGARFGDATLIGATLLPVFVPLLDAARDEHGRVENPELLGRLRDLVGPTAAHLHLSNHAAHLLHHGFFAISKMLDPPQRGRQVLKLTRQEYFGVAWELYTVAVEAGLLAKVGYTSWANALSRVEKGRAAEEVVPEESRRPSRRRPRRRRRKKS